MVKLREDRVAHAITNAWGIHLRTLPMTAENILMKGLEREETP